MATSAGGKQLVQFVAANVRNARLGVGLTQAQLAELIGVDVRQLQNIEAARSGPSFDALAALAEALGMPASKLLEPVRFKNAKRGRPRKSDVPE